MTSNDFSLHRTENNTTVERPLRLAWGKAAEAKKRTVTGRKLSKAHTGR